MSLNRRQFIKLAGLGIGGALLPSGGIQAAEGVDGENGVAMLYDTTLCIGCRACQNACREWNKTDVEQDASGLYDAPLELSADTWTLIQLYEQGGEHSFVKHQCMHCLHPACVSACPVQALQKTAEGPVTYDLNRCVGCRYCMTACPFSVPRFEWDEAIPVIAKCTFCVDRLAAGDGPNCAEKCPTGALIWGRRGDLLAEAEGRLANSSGKYVNQIYGKDDGGGTSVLYLSHVSFDKLGFPELGTRPIPELNDRLSPIILPSLFVGVPLVLAGVRYMATRRQKAEEEGGLT
jgi:formate dehydrogenase iron-sulfur subunit